jgi:hypothetical protein
MEICIRTWSYHEGKITIKAGEKRRKRARGRGKSRERGHMVGERGSPHEHINSASFFYHQKKTTTSGLAFGSIQ